MKLSGVLIVTFESQFIVLPGEKKEKKTWQQNPAGVMCSEALKVLVASPERCLPLPISQWAMKCKIPSNRWLWIAHMSDLCGLHTELRRGFWGWRAHGQRERAVQAKWITWLHYHSLHVYTWRPHLSIGSIVEVTILYPFTGKGFIIEDSVQAWNMLGNKWISHLDAFQFWAISRHSNCTNCLLSVSQNAPLMERDFAWLKWEFCLTHSIYFCN